jgi:hypothetical protein
MVKHQSLRICPFSGREGSLPYPWLKASINTAFSTVGTVGEIVGTLEEKQELSTVKPYLWKTAFRPFNTHIRAHNGKLA